LRSLKKVDIPVSPWLYVFILALIFFGIFSFTVAFALVAAMVIGMLISGTSQPQLQDGSSVTDHEKTGQIDSLSKELGAIQLQLKACGIHKSSQVRTLSQLVQKYPQLTKVFKLSAALCLDRLQAPLSSALSAVETTYTAYKALSERMQDIDSTKHLRLTRSIESIKHSLRSQSRGPQPIPHPRDLQVNIEPNPSLEASLMSITGCLSACN
jgi:hypothetical protein